jgi:TPR repeat protein
MRMVAVRYQTGLGVDVNNEKSVEWLQRSADQGNFEAQSSLGFAYLMGIGVSKDYEQALALFLGSAGVAQSRFYISNFYTHGWVGAKDKIKAYMWCLLATEMGFFPFCCG